MPRQESGNRTLQVERRDARYRDIQARWLAGESMIKIADAHGVTITYLGTLMAKMRATGWDLPNRYRLRRKQAA